MDDPDLPATGRTPSVALKPRLRQLLLDRDLAGVARAADHGHRVMGVLIALTYDQPTVAWRAVEALGVAADRLADRHPDAVRNYLRRLLWLISEESGGVCWFAPQGMAEIVRQRPERFGDYIPITANLVTELAEEDLEHFRPGALWAIGRLGSLAEPHLEDIRPAIEQALEHPDPRVRGMAAWAAGEAGPSELVASRPALLADQGELELYVEGELRNVTVATLARAAAGGTAAL
ncbi:MAG: DVU0298 family protein [Gemmatimonadota bacterium]